MRQTPRSQRAPSAKLQALVWLGLAAAACGGDGAVVVDGGSSSSTGTTVAATTGTPGDLPPVAATTGDLDTTGGSSETTGGSSGSTTSSQGTTTTGTGDTTGGSSESGEPAIPGPKIKVMTFNIRVGTADDGANAWDKRKQLVYQVFTAQDADFVGVQEALAFQLQAIDGNVSGYKRIGVGTEDGAAKGPINAIYYRKARFEVDDSDTFWLSDTPNKPGSQTWGNAFPRAVTWGHFVEKDTAYSLYVYNTHFDHVSQHSRELSAVLLAKKVAARAVPEDPFVVTGDFNAAEGNLATRYLQHDAKIDGMNTPAPMLDTFRVLSPDADNFGTAHGFDGGTGGNKIDYVYVPPQQDVVNAYISHFNVDGRYPSDHFPVIGVVKFAARP